MNYYLAVLKKYAVFSGRATRSEYWYFVLFNTIILLILSLIDGSLTSGEGGIISGLYSLAVLIPSLAVGARRLHDTGRSGWMLLLMLIPLIGSIWLIVLFVQDSKADNKYGPNPKGGATPAQPETPPAPPVQ